MDYWFDLAQLLFSSSNYNLIFCEYKDIFLCFQTDEDQCIPECCREGFGKLWVLICHGYTQIDLTKCFSVILWSRLGILWNTSQVCVHYSKKTIQLTLLRRILCA